MLGSVDEAAEERAMEWGLSARDTVSALCFQLQLKGWGITNRFVEHKLQNPNSDSLHIQGRECQCCVQPQNLGDCFPLRKWTSEFNEGFKLAEIKTEDPFSNPTISFPSELMEQACGKCPVYPGLMDTHSV
ncbi:uncharacterized protein LOC121826335 isoform X3 [Peromyscus maniculatus bairdii]|uniref:uncharacterized protein LOC121826335 isoform X3 n=1 Tax=Peromyscus maniculatus bairdii TaxID=230844 RepID=UPI003FD4CA14